MPSATVGEWREPPYLNPPSGRALDPSPTVGEWREAYYINPPSGRALDPSPTVGFGREAPSTHPPSGRATPLTRGVALVHGGQRPISLEYQINRLLLSYLIL